MMASSSPFIFDPDDVADKNPMSDMKQSASVEYSVDSLSTIDSRATTEIEAAKSDGIAIILDQLQPNSLAEQLANLLCSRKPGIAIEIIPLICGKALLVNVTTINSFLAWAEDVHMLRRERNSEHYRIFTVKNVDQFDGSDQMDTFFTCSERQQLLKYAVESVQAQDAKEIFGKVELRRGQAIVPKLLSRGVIKMFFPLHHREELKLLRKKWLTSPAWYNSFKLPLDDIQSYFDCSISYYFAWLAFYTKWLLLPALFGLLMWNWCGSDESSTNSSHHQSFKLLAIVSFNFLWFAMFQKFWKRKCSQLAFRWGALDHRDTSEKYFAEPRPLFNGSPAINSVTGKQTLYWPSWQRYAIYTCISIPATVIGVSFMMKGALFCLDFQKPADDYAAEFPEPISTAISILPLISLICVLNVFNNVFQLVAVSLNNLENHFSQSDYLGHLQAKLILFRFCNGFLPLFYTAFIAKDFTRLREQVAALVMLRQVGSNVVELFLPYIQSRYQQYTLRKKEDQDHQQSSHSSSVFKSVIRDTRMVLSLFRRHKKHRTRSSPGTKTDLHDVSNSSQVGTGMKKQIEEEALMPQFDDCFEDYLEMFIQLAYILLFSAAFPPTAFWCLVNNLVEIKTDAAKMLAVYQRPFARRRTRDIGIWAIAFDVLAIVAVLVNVGLFITHAEMHSFLPSPAEDLSRHFSTVLIIGLTMEHGAFVAALIINYAIDSIPESIQQQLAKRDYQRQSKE